MTAKNLNAPIFWLYERALRAQEKRYDYNMNHVRHLWHVAPKAFEAFAFRFMAYAKTRISLPADAAAVAGIIGTRHADCGPCTQITVNMALEAGVDPAVLKAAIEGNVGALNPNLALVYRFSEAIMAGDYTAGEMREQLRRIYGEEGLVDLALTLSSSQVYPVLKRTLGYGEACMKVRVKNDDVTASRAA